MKVLIAEDCVNSREALAEFFRSRGCTVVIAEDGLQACMRLQADVFDAVIVHLNLPRGGASEVAQAAWARNPAAIVVVVTAYGNGFRPVFRAPGSNVFLVEKPFRAGQLLHLIQEAHANLSVQEAADTDEIDMPGPVVQYAVRSTDAGSKC